MNEKITLHFIICMQFTVFFRFLLILNKGTKTLMSLQTGVIFLKYEFSQF